MAECAELAQKADWVAHQIRMLRSCADRVQAGRRDADGFYACLVTEGFALHLLALVEFFFPRVPAGPEEQATVYDFLDKLRWDEARPLDSHAFRDLDCLAVHHLAHLTFWLPGGQTVATAEGVAECRAKMDRLIATFLRLVPPSRCSERLLTLKAEAEAEAR